MRRFEASLTVVLVAAEVVVAAAVAKREFTSSSTRATNDREVTRAEWQDLLQVGHPLGDTTGQVKIAVLADFECPACRHFHIGLERALAVAPAALDVRLVHLPLPYHPYALPSARVFECAVQGGTSARRVASELYERQDSLGLLSWREFATRAGSPDPLGVEACMQSSDSTRFQRIAAGLTLGERIGAPGTPTVVVNGVLRRFPPTESQLLELAKVVR